MAKQTKGTGDRHPEIIKIGNRLRELRKELGYESAEKFAWENKINRVQYWRMENGQNFTLESLFKVLDAMETSFQTFVGGIEK
ncbi:MAG: helix-turn-helix transcriptional regulator [Bacteroidia bacterium]|nr:helix-turn-helix transcriptional regulator [Bacteroidia bacterium]